MGRVRGAVGIAILAIALFFAAAPAGATPSGLVLSTDHIGKGGAVTVRGEGFAPNSSVQLLNGKAVGTFGDTFGTPLRADGSGVVTAVVGRQLGAGMYRVRLTGLTPTNDLRSLSGVYTKQDGNCPAGQVPTSDGGCATLPRTGGTTPWLIVGGLLVVGVVGRRSLRRHAAPVGAAALVLVVGVGFFAVDRAPAHASTLGQIRGVLRATDGHAATGMCVHAANAHDFASAVTDGDGNFALHGLPAGAYRVNAADCNATTLLLGRSLGTARVTGITTVVHGAVDRGAVLIGRVHTPAGAPVAAECIRVAAKTAFTHACVAGSDLNGLYVSEPLRAGRYRVAFQDLSNAHALQYLGGTASPKHAKVAALQPGKVYSSDVSAQAAGTISGKVTDASNNSALSGICVSLYDDGQPTMVSAATSGDGTYTLQGVAQGDHQVGFYDCNSDGHDYTLEFFDNKADLASANTVTNDGASNTPNINAALAPKDTSSSSTSSSSSSSS